LPKTAGNSAKIDQNSSKTAGNTAKIDQNSPQNGWKYGQNRPKLTQNGWKLGKVRSNRMDGWILVTGWLDGFCGHRMAVFFF